MSDDFFLGFAAHAHTRNELEPNPELEIKLRTQNTVEEARELVTLILDKLQKDITDDGYGLDDVKLLVLYLSYRGEPEEKDRAISESVLRALEARFNKHVAADGLRLIGHTTAAELENDDLKLKNVSGIGYNGLSLMALVTSLPVGVGRTWGLRTDREAAEQGLEMTRDVWLDFSKHPRAKDHLQRNKILHVLTQGATLTAPGHEHFLAEGIANFMGGTREARIMNVIGGSGGDGLIAQRFYQYYGRLGEQPQFKILDGEAVCALIPTLTEASLGLDVDATTRIGREYTFHFDQEKQPKFRYVKKIGKMDPQEAYAKVICENETRMSKNRNNVPVMDEKAVQDIMAGQPLLVFSPVVGKYSFAFPFGNYTCVTSTRVVDKDLELLRPVRSYTPQMPGYVVMGDFEKVQKGAWRVYNMLRIDKGFGKRDATIIVTCISRRLVELMAGCECKTEAEILKEGFSSTQFIGFLSYGELAFTNLIQEPYFWNFSCWGMTLRSQAAEKQRAADVSEQKRDMGIKRWIRGKNQ